MKILIATGVYPPQIGGPAKYAQALYEEFGRLGHRTRVVSYQAIGRLLPPGLRHVWYFVRLLPHAVRADAVLALDTWSVGLPACAAARLTGTKFVVRIGGDYLWESYVERTGEMVKLSAFYVQPHLHPLSFKERLIYRTVSCMARCATFAFNTIWQKELWMRAYRLDPQRCAVVENIFPLKMQSKPWNEKVFLAAGRDIKLKNIPLLKRVFAGVKARHPEIELDTRPLPPQAHAERLASCYAVVVPSVSEVNPNTVIEAVASGKPFVATSDTGADARLAGAGIFVDTQDEQALEQALESLLEPGTYEHYATAASTSYGPRMWSEVSREYLMLLQYPV